MHLLQEDNTKGEVLKELSFVAQKVWARVINTDSLCLLLNPNLTRSESALY